MKRIPTESMVNAVAVYTRMEDSDWQLDAVFLWESDADAYMVTRKMRSDVPLGCRKRRVNVKVAFERGHHE